MSRIDIDGVFSTNHKALELIPLDLIPSSLYNSRGNVSVVTFAHKMATRGLGYQNCVRTLRVTTPRRTSTFSTDTQQSFPKSSITTGLGNCTTPRMCVDPSSRKNSDSGTWIRRRLDSNPLFIFIELNSHIHVSFGNYRNFLHVAWKYACQFCLIHGKVRDLAWKNFA